MYVNNKDTKIKLFVWLMGGNLFIKVELNYLDLADCKPEEEQAFACSSYDFLEVEIISF